MSYNFVIGPTDTDSISVGKPDGSAFSKEEIKNLTDELMSISPDKMIWEDDGYYPTVIILKTKNYILWDGQKKTIKGSSLKDAKTEKALKYFLNEIIDAIIHDTKDYKEIYERYVKEALNITDMSRWSSKKTISTKVLSSERANESKVRDAIEGSEIVEGDRIWTYFTSDNRLQLLEKFDGDYNEDRMLEKLYKKAMTFKEVIPKDTFINYKLKKNKKLLQGLE